jgi:hypothetical protein
MVAEMPAVAKISVSTAEAEASSGVKTSAGKALPSPQ